MPAGQVPPEPGLPPPVYETEAELARAHLRMWRFAVRNRHVTIPLAVPAAMLAAGGILAGEHAAFETGIIGAAASAATWFIAPAAQVTRDGERVAKWSMEPRIRDWAWASEVSYVRDSVITASLWLFLAALFGPRQPGLEYMLAVLCLAWGGLFWWHKRPRDKRARRRHARRVENWNLWWQSHAPAWDVAGSGVVDLKDHGAMESLLIQLWAGRQSAATIKGIIPLLESALGGYVHHGMTRPEVNKANPSQVWVHLKREDPLREVIEWDDAMAPGDITAPAPLGVRETGTWLNAVLRRGWFINGKTRKGKSNELSVLFASITSCRNARLWLIDRKGGRSMRPWLAAVDWPAVTIDESRLMLACAVAEEKARGTYAYNGEEQLTPTDEVPAIFTAIDEANGVTSEQSGDSHCAASLATLAGEGSGLEMYAIVSTQYGALEESVRTEQVRGNLDGRMCFQVDSPAHGTFALGDDAHGKADPTTLREPGQFYCRLNAQTSPEQIRGPHLPHRQAAEIARRNAGRTGLHDRRLLLYCGNQPSAVPGKTWQQVYDERWSRLPETFRRDAPQAADLANPSPGETVEDPANKINITVQPPIHEEAAAINAEVDEYTVTDADIDRARRLREARGEPPVDLASETDRRRHRFAVLLQGAPDGGISPDQLYRGSGMGRTWVHQQLNALIAGGAVAKIRDGLYAPLGDVWEAMEAINREAGDLATVAHELTGV